MKPYRHEVIRKRWTSADASQHNPLLFVYYCCIEIHASYYTKDSDSQAISLEFISFQLIKNIICNALKMVRHIEMPKPKYINDVFMY